MCYTRTALISQIISSAPTGWYLQKKEGFKELDSPHFILFDMLFESYNSRINVRLVVNPFETLNFHGLKD